MWSYDFNVTVDLMRTDFKNVNSFEMLLELVAMRLFFSAQQRTFRCHGTKSSRYQKRNFLLLIGNLYHERNLKKFTVNKVRSHQVWFLSYNSCFIQPLQMKITHSLTHGAEPFLRSCQFCSYSRTSQHFMEPGGSLPYSQKPSTGPYPQPDQSNPYHPILSL
jgi:hypothetical protein